MAPYTYLAGSLLTFAFWLFLFLKSKETRREMLVMSLILLLPAIFLEAFFWTRDWWAPETLFGTRIGIEDLIFGFSTGGVVAVCYGAIFRYKLSKKGGARAFSFLSRTQFLASIGILALSGLVGHLLLEISSFWAWLITVCPAILYIYLERPDLIPDSLASGAIFALFFLPVFFVLNLIDPGFVSRWWLFNNLSGIIFLGVPLEDLVWFFTTGLLGGPLYEFWLGARLSR